MPVFQMYYERNPARCKYDRRLEVNTSPLNIVYNPLAMKKVSEFFYKGRVHTSGEFQNVSSTGLVASSFFLKSRLKLRKRYEVQLKSLNVVDNYPGFGCQSELELRVAEAARRQYNKLKMQTKAEIRQTIDQLLVGEFIVRVNYVTSTKHLLVVF